MMRRLEKLQDVLGAHQDAVSQTAWLRGHAEAATQPPATLLTMDFFREWYPEASPRSEVVVGRIATGAVVVLGICWVLVIKSLHSDLYVYLQSVQGYMSPAIAALFLFGVFWKRATAPAALYALVIGLVGGMVRLAADLIMRHDGAGVTTLKQQLYQGLITAAQFDEMFPNEEACRAYLIARRWPNGVHCPRCGNAKVYALKSGFHWQCEECAEDGYRFSHISNGGLTGRNPGLNIHSILIGTRLFSRAHP